MQVDADDFSRRLTAIGATDAVVPLRLATMHALSLFGVRSAYFLAPLTKDPRIGRIVTNMGLSWVWERHYRSGLHLLDPMPEIAVDRLEAVIWPDQIDMAALDDRKARYMRIAAQHGLVRGVGVACFGPNARSGYLGAVLQGDETPGAIVLQCIHAIGQTSFQRYCRLVRDHADIPDLSNRELEVLHWIGRGKSNSVIAAILDISASSVDVYVRRLFAKLRVSDRTSASLKAHSQGLLVSGDYERFVRDSAMQQAAVEGRGED